MKSPTQKELMQRQVNLLVSTRSGDIGNVFCSHHSHDYPLLRLDQEIEPAILPAKE
jgi:hypothetical protein